jgi:hypothetical protein
MRGQNQHHIIKQKILINSKKKQINHRKQSNKKLILIVKFHTGSKLKKILLLYNIRTQAVARLFIKVKT